MTDQIERVSHLAKAFIAGMSAICPEVSMLIAVSETTADGTVKVESFGGFTSNKTILAALRSANKTAAIYSEMTEFDEHRAVVKEITTAIEEVFVKADYGLPWLQEIYRNKL